MVPAILIKSGMTGWVSPTHEGRRLARERKPKDWVPIIDRFDWPDAPLAEMIEFVRGHERKGTTGSWTVADSDDPVRGRKGMPDCYKEQARTCLDQVGYEYDPTKWRYWVGLSRSDTKGRLPGFAQSFPHTHQWHGVTVVTPVQAPLSGGDLVLLEDDEQTEIFRFEPVVGVSCVLDGWTCHGISTVHGDIDRLTLIATAFPPDG